VPIAAGFGISRKIGDVALFSLLVKVQKGVCKKYPKSKSCQYQNSNQEIIAHFEGRFTAPRSAAHTGAPKTEDQSRPQADNDTDQYSKNHGCGLHIK
jgi:hypothetical protein